MRIATLDHLPVHLQLHVLFGKMIANHEEEFGTVQSDSL